MNERLPCKICGRQVEATTAWYKAGDGLCEYCRKRTAPKKTPAESYSLWEFIWIPLLSGAIITVVAFVKGIPFDFADGQHVVLVSAVIFAVGAAAAIPLMVYDSIENGCLRNLVLFSGILALAVIVVAAIVIFTLD